MKTLLLRRTLLLAATLATLPAAAQSDYPNRPVKVIVSLPPGSGADTIARYLSTQLQARFKQTFVVENRVGANSFIAARAAATAPADGYTIFVASNSPMTTNAVVFKELPYDPVKDFVPLGLAARFPMAFVVPAASPHRNLAELVAALKKAPGKFSYGSGTATYRLAVEQFHMLNDVSAVHVPYKGTSAALVDVGGGVVDYTVADVSAAQPLIKGGKVRALATTGAARTKELPDAPTMIESGNPGYEFYAWIGAFAPAKTDPEVVRRLAAAITDIVGSPEMAGFLAGIGGEPFPLGPDKAREFQAAEIGNMRRVAVKAKVEPE